MSKEMIQTEVEKSGYDAVMHAMKIVKAFKDALKDGFQAGQDLPVGIAVLISEVPAIVADLPEFSGDLAESKVLFGKGVVLAALEGADLLSQ